MAKAKRIPKVDLAAPLLVTAGRMIHARLDEMLAWEDCLADCDRVYDLHQMRIAAKRLRYTLEIFHEVYKRQVPVAAEYACALEEIRTLQDHLGALHDADVLTPGLLQQLSLLLRMGDEEKVAQEIGTRHIDFGACSGLVTLCRETRAGRDLRYDLLLSHWRRLRADRVFEQLRALLDTVSASAKPAGSSPSMPPEPQAVSPDGVNPEVPRQDAA